MTLDVSFEVFPPKSVDGLDALRTTVARLGDVGPAFVSVTYGAGGSDRERSFAAIDAVRSTGVEVAGHLTCVGQSRREVDEVIERYAGLGVSQIVALRGDPPGGVDRTYTPHAEGHRRTADLVRAIKRRGDFGVSVSAYPERHPESPTEDHDLDVLADKVAAGADRAITQMFFDNDHYLRLRDRAEARRIDIPIVPGIFPIHCITTVSRFAERCGASMPRSVTARFAETASDDEARQNVAAELAAEQITALTAHGVEQFHIYTLNRADLALRVCEHLGVASPLSR
ncbi:MAG TPA: methylenetetrahydrofolate reductase [NAD(P)H] [Ilumatobacteraceae bacterium]|nr:methylenetetrahydrofolate reductase [NAD(P)H] [Ilumatobacteraceae bacterium]